MTAVRRWRIGLVAFGVALLGLGGVVLLSDVDPARYAGLAAWLLGALVIHDGVVAFAVLGVSIVLRRAGTRIPLPVIAMIQGALVVAAVVTALVLPEIVKKAIGTANPTILPLDYGANLLAFYAGLALVTAAAIAAYLAVARRRIRSRRG